MIRPMLDRPGTAPLLAALRACRRHILDAAAFSAFLNLLYLAPTLYMLQVYDRVLPTRGAMTLGFLTAIFLLAIASLAGLDLVRTRLMVRASARLDRMLAGPVLDALLRSGRDARPATATVLREFDMLRQTITGPGILALFDAPWSPIYIFVCFLLHPALGALALVASATLLAVSLASERRTRAPLTEAGRAAAASYGDIDAMLSSAGVVQALGMRQALVARALRERLRGGDRQTAIGLSSASFVSATKALRLLFQSLGLGLGAWLAISGRITPGSIFAASLLVSRALQPIELVTGAWRNIIQSRAAFASLTTLFAEAGEARATTTLPSAMGRVEVVNLAVPSPTRDRLLLSGITFALDPGETLGIIGPSGAGKSTLARALVGAQPTSGGTVRIDGAMPADWPEDQLAAAIGYLPQEGALFRGTVKDNIARFETEQVDEGALDEAITAAALACGVHDLILRLPKAYATELGWHGAGLSTGQRQRIALARALYREPRLIVLDEPATGLDADGQRALAATLTALRARGATVIVVAHGGDVLRIADKLLVLRDGRMDMFGPRETVLEKLAGPAPPRPRVVR